MSFLFFGKEFQHKLVVSISNLTVTITSDVVTGTLPFDVKQRALINQINNKEVYIN